MIRITCPQVGFLVEHSPESLTDDSFSRELCRSIEFDAQMSQLAMWIDMALGAGSGNEATRQAIEIGKEIGRTTLTPEREAILQTMQRFHDTVVLTRSGWVSCGQKPLTVEDWLYEAKEKATWVSRFQPKTSCFPIYRMLP